MQNPVITEGEQVMTDTPIKEVLDEVVNESEPVETQPVEESKAVDQQPEITQEEVETFAEKGELQGRTPEELEEIYKNWQRAYTEKRQKETQELRALREQLEQRKVEKPTSDESRSVAQIRQDMGQAQQDVQLGRMSVEEYTNYMRELMKEEARQVAREEYKEMTTQERESQYQDQAFKEFVSADERGRLDPNSPTADETLSKVVRDYLAEELEKYIQEHRTAKDFPAGKLAKEKTAEYDARIDEIVKTRTKQSTQMAQVRAAKAQKASTRGSDASSAPTSGSSIRDILVETIESSGA